MSATPSWPMWRASPGPCNRPSNPSDKLSHLHFHLAPKYVDGPDYGGTFQMNPGKVYLTDEEYAQMISQIKQYL